MKALPLTPADRRVWAALSNARSPLTMKEICAACRYVSTNTAWRHMKRLEAAGIVVREGHRAYRLLEPFQWIDV